MGHLRYFERPHERLYNLEDQKQGREKRLVKKVVRIFRPKGARQILSCVAFVVSHRDILRARDDVHRLQYVAQRYSNSKLMASPGASTSYIDDRQNGCLYRPSGSPPCFSRLVPLESVCA